jgi:mono/diheme cytochrome c family protein
MAACLSMPAVCPAEELVPMAVKRVKTFIFAIVVVLIIVLAVGLIRRLTSDVPVVYDDIENHYKYGSTGGERSSGLQPGFGIPYWIWVILPELFPEHLPDQTPGRGYASFGMLYEPGRDPRFELPIGISTRLTQGIDRVYFNCASCHTGSVRETPSSDPQYVIGMPSNTFDLGRFGRFLFDVAGDRRMTPEYVMAEIADMQALRAREYPQSPGYRPADLDFINRLTFKFIGVYLLRDHLLNVKGQLSHLDPFMWGPGRVDTFNTPKAFLGFRMDNASPKELLGIVDFPSIWFQKGRRGMQLHWDGNNTSVDERNLSAAFGTGATPPTLDKEKVLRVADFLWDQAEPPAFPEARIDKALAPQGAPIYRQYCWGCHGNRRPPFKGDGEDERVGTVVPIDTIGTDRWRLDSYTPELASAQNMLYAGFPKIGEDACKDQPQNREDCYPARFSHFRKTYGYANMPLDGLWLRAPYLHNGSVPNLRELLEPSDQRTTVFYLGNDVYDYDNVGFVYDVEAQHGRSLWKLDTRVPGNGNQGHEGPAYGTELSPEDKKALIEYLKTF